MIVFDQVVGFILWFGVVMLAVGMQAALAWAARSGVWYRGGGRPRKRDVEKDSQTWFGRLIKPKIMLGTTAAIVISIIANLALVWSAAWPWIFYDGSHTDIFGILAYSFFLGVVLLEALYAPIFYWAETVVGGMIVVVFQFLLAAAGAIMLALATWVAGHMVIGDISPFITACVYVAYVIYQLIYHGMLYAAQDGDYEDEDDEELVARA